MEKIKVSQIAQEIENKRMQLKNVVKIHKSFTHPQVLQVSQELDRLLNSIDHKWHLLSM